jgi:hypothetical protein
MTYERDNAMREVGEVRYQTHRDEVVRAIDTVRVRSARSRDFVPGRICIETSCDTTLSLYNPGPHCFVHAEPRFSQTRHTRALVRT